MEANEGTRNIFSEGTGPRGINGKSSTIGHTNLRRQTQTSVATDLGGRSARFLDDATDAWWMLRYEDLYSWHGQQAACLERAREG